MEASIEIAMKLNPGIVPAVILAGPTSFETALRELGYNWKQIVRLGGPNHFDTAIKTLG